MVNQTSKYLIYIMLTHRRFLVFSLTTLIFVNSVALKNQLTSNWTGSDIVKDNFPITQAQYVMGDYNSREQSI